MTHITDPNDSCFSVYDLSNGFDEDVVPGEITCGLGHRASSQRRYADEMGLEFGDVRCLKKYVHIRTWQEVWDDNGRERVLEDTMEEHAIESYWFMDDFGYRIWGYRDADTHESWREKDVEALVPVIVPPHWNPDYIYGAYTWVESSHPQARPVWVCSVH